MNMFKPAGAKTAEEYINMISEPRKSHIMLLDQLIRKTVPKLKPTMMYSMLGYGTFHYKGKSGREGDWCVIGLASQKNYISLYICAVEGKEYVAEKYKDKLPKASIGKSCIRFKKPEDVDLNVIKEILLRAAKNPGFLQNSLKTHFGYRILRKLYVYYHPICPIILLSALNHGILSVRFSHLLQPEHHTKGKVPHEHPFPGSRASRDRDRAGGAAATRQPRGCQHDGRQPQIGARPTQPGEKPGLRSHIQLFFHLLTPHISPI
ncbi:MAG: hypothetical protein UZ22_OP11002000765 [Microgenomates bacterium OLB23]|nr:MAG: hypothetical protein UZ22_OP11002000765 [Microgenomates bacterium OLB23]